MNAQRRKGILYILASAVIFGFTPVLAALSYRGGNNGINMAFLRALMPVVPLVFLSGAHKKRIAKGKQLRIGILAGTVMFSCTLLLYSSYAYIPVGLATTLHFLYPLYVVLFETLFKKKKLKPLQIIGLVLSLAGVFISVDLTGGGSLDLRGVILTLLSGIAFAAYILIIGAEAKDPLPVFRLMLLVSLSGVFLCGSAGVLLGKLTVSLEPAAWVCAILCALLVSLGGSTLFQIGTRYVGETDAAVYSLLEPIGCIVFGALLMGDVLTVNGITGCAMILAGLLCNALSEKRN